MNTEDAILLANDCYVGNDGGDGQAICLFVYGIGIELKNMEEVRAAYDIQNAFNRFALEHKIDRQEPKATFPRAQHHPKCPNLHGGEPNNPYAGALCCGKCYQVLDNSKGE